MWTNDTLHGSWNKNEFLEIIFTLLDRNVQSIVIFANNINIANKYRKFQILMKIGEKYLCKV